MSAGIRESIEAIQKALCEGADIIKLGMLTITCEHVVIGVEEQISNATAEALKAHTSGLRLYVSQFPDWRRFIGNSENIEVSKPDVEKLLDATHNIVGALIENSDVDEAVPRVINFVANLVRNPSETSKKAVFALLRTIENLIAKVFGYLSDFIGDVAEKTASKASGAIAIGIATIIVGNFLGASSFFKSIPESAWVSDASKIVEQYILGKVASK